MAEETTMMMMTMMTMMNTKVAKEESAVNTAIALKAMKMEMMINLK
jgi:hypothetical protein